MVRDAFVETWGIKYDKAVDCLIKDRDALLAFYDFPAEHWKTSAHDQRHRKRIRDRTSSHRARKGMSLDQDRAGYDPQARRGRRKKLASPRWSQPIAESHPRCKVYRRNGDR